MSMTGDLHDCISDQRYMCPSASQFFIERKGLKHADTLPVSLTVDAQDLATSHQV